jgi:hypothetical protein
VKAAPPADLSCQVHGWVCAVPQGAQPTATGRRAGAALPLISVSALPLRGEANPPRNEGNTECGDLHQHERTVAR